MKHEQLIARRLTDLAKYLQQVKHKLLYVQDNEYLEFDRYIADATGRRIPDSGQWVYEYVKGRVSAAHILRALRNMAEQTPFDVKLAMEARRRS